MLMAKGISLTADQGSAGCISSFYTELRHFGTADLFVAGWRTPRASRKWLDLGWPMVWGMLKKRRKSRRKGLTVRPISYIMLTRKWGESDGHVAILRAALASFLSDLGLASLPATKINHIGSSQVISRGFVARSRSRLVEIPRA